MLGILLCQNVLAQPGTTTEEEVNKQKVFIEANKQKLLENYEEATVLFKEVLKANLAVVKACLRADLDINPALVKVKTVCQSDLAKTMFANSITLTPGTVTIEVERGRMLVHALFEEDASPDAFAEMDARSARAIDGRKRGQET